MPADGLIEVVNATTPTGDSLVLLRELAIRQDGTDTIVGRIDTGDFIAIPSVGARTLELLRDGHTVTAVQRQVNEEVGQRVDVVQFVESLIALGYVAEIDGRPVPGPSPMRPSFPRLRPEHVSWMLSPIIWLSAAAIIAVGILLVTLGLASVPRYRDLLWSDHGSTVLLGNAITGWSLIAVHELAHLSTARAAGVPGRIGFATRLQFLAAQTDVSGIWAAPRRHRIAVYAAGMATDAVAASLALIISTAAGGSGPAHQAAMVVVAMVLISLAWQLLIFMRTDVYFICQDVSGHRNLYADGTSYCRYLTSRLARLVHYRRVSRADPTRQLSPGQRRMVRAYAALLVVGTVACLGMAALVTVPVEVSLLTNATRNLVGGELAEVGDAVIVLSLLGSVHVLWAIMWWRRHGPTLLRIRRKLRIRRQRG